jgi:hypothetical protein
MMPGMLGLIVDGVSLLFGRGLYTGRVYMYIASRFSLSVLSHSLDIHIYRTEAVLEYYVSCCGWNTLERVYHADGENRKPHSPPVTVGKSQKE